MIEEVADVAPDTLQRYEAIIDVRSPAEFTQDRIPGAVNLPVLSDAERAEVGAIYVQRSRFEARRLGAAYVARNVASHLQSALAGRDARFRPLVYCWRGGMRSNAMATILSQIGWRVGVLHGGYRTWRREVVRTLMESSAPLKLVLIDGQTGTAKTEVLRRLQLKGVQTIDLEGLASHKGSVFGAAPDKEQPSQKLFESELYDRLRAFDHARPVAVEAESARIGRLVLPKRLWAAMRAAPRLLIEAHVEARAEYLSRAYAELIAAPDAVVDAVNRLRPFHAQETIEEWLALAARGDHSDLAATLMRRHYDPLYDRSRKRDDRKPIARIRARALTEEGVEAVAAEAAEIIRAGLSRSQP